LKAIKLKFDYRALETTQSPSYALISGDFFVTPDDLAWKVNILWHILRYLNAIETEAVRFIVIDRYFRGS
jgi:hypothetical protein